MKLIILGSGTCVPSLKRSAPANFLKILNNNILVDCGSGALHQLIKVGLSYKDIDFVFITHFHPDHICELNALILALSHTPDYDRKKDLVLVGPTGFKKYYDQKIGQKPRPNTYHIKIREIKKKMKFNGFAVEAEKTIHSDESIAYKFTEKNKILTISGDCDFDNNLITFSKNSNLLLIECSFPNEMKKVGHLIPSECGKIAKQAKVKKLVLTHLYLTSPEIIRLNQTKKIFKNTILAEDLLTINI